MGRVWRAMSFINLALKITIRWLFLLLILNLIMRLIRQGGGVICNQ